MRLIHEFDFAELPGLVEGGLLRAVDAEHQEEVLAGRNPVRLLPSGAVGAK
jgi:hypothetical protein